MATSDDQARAIELHRSGNFAEAEKIYRRILVKEPNSAGTLFLLGSVAHQTNRPQEAEELVRKAISLNPNSADYFVNLGVIVGGRIVTARRRNAIGGPWP